MSFRIELTEEAKRNIDGLAKAGKIDLRPTFNVIGIGYRKEVGGIFDKQQPRGEAQRWPQLSDKYAAWKAKRYPGMPLLVRTGKLKASMTKQGAEGSINIISKLSAVFGSTVAYGVYHDEGGSKLPRRNFSDVSERRKDIWIKQIDDAMRYNFEKNGVKVDGALAV